MFEKKLLVLLSASSLFFNVALAQSASTNSNNNLAISIPDLKTGFEYSFTALALKPSASNLNYVIYNKALPLETPNWIEEELNPNYGFGYELGTRYVFSVGQDLNVDWTHFNSTTTASVAAPDSQYFIGPDYEIGPDGETTRNASGSANFKYDVVNVDFGQYLDLGKHVEMRFFGGLSTGFLREGVKLNLNGSYYAGEHAGDTFTMNSDNESRFTGLGPRLGLQLNYNTDHHFGFFGEAAGSALVGTSYTNASYTTVSPIWPNVNAQTIIDQKVTQVIPGFDAKLGMNYHHAMGKDALFTLEGGYQAAVYINAINQYKPQSLVTSIADGGGIYVATMNHTQSNYSVQGPFLKFAIQF